MNYRWGNPRFIDRRLVAVADRVYATLGYSPHVSRGGRIFDTFIRESQRDSVC